VDIYFPIFVNYQMDFLFVENKIYDFFLVAGLRQGWWMGGWEIVMPRMSVADSHNLYYPEVA
jgi:hypothetical protein